MIASQATRLLRAVFVPATPASVAVQRAGALGRLVVRLADDPEWRQAGSLARRQFASRVLFTRWLVETGRLSEIDEETKNDERLPIGAGR